MRKHPKIGDRIHFKNGNHEFYAKITRVEGSQWDGEITKFLFSKWLDPNSTEVNGSLPNPAIEILWEEAKPVGKETIKSKEGKSITFEVKHAI